MAKVKKDFKILERHPTKGYGTKGEEINLIANVFEVKVENPSFCIHHYDVLIEKWVDGKGKRKAKQKEGENKEDKQLLKALTKGTKRYIFRLFCEENRLDINQIGYDGEKNAYSCQHFKNKKNEIISIKPDNGLGVSTKEDSKNKDKRVHRSKHRFIVSFKLVSSVNFKDLFDVSKTFLAENQDTSPLQAVNVMFHSFYAQKLQAISSDRFFSVDGEFGNATRSLGKGLMAVQGFFANLRPHGWKGETLLMKLNASFATFLEELPVIEFLKKNDINVEQKLNKSSLNKASKLLRGLKIERNICYKTKNKEIKYEVRTHQVLSVTVEGADNLKFIMGGGEETSVKDYFEDQIGDSLKFPSLNCLHVGNPEKNVWIPMEVCKIKKGQRKTVKVNSDELKTLIGFASNSPRDLFNKILTLRSKGKFDNLAVIKDMGMTISNEMLKFTGRVIPPPELYMKRGGKDFPITPKNGNLTLFNAKVYLGIDIKNWIILNFDNNFSRVKDLIDSMIRQGKYLGVNIEEPKVKCGSSDINFKDFVNEKPQLILCIMYEKKNGIYGKIKEEGEINTSILTQCLRTTVANDAIYKPFIMKNIILQINAKLGGTNYIINPKLMKFADPTIIMGADVNHPSPVAGAQDSNIDAPSFVAVVASCDLHAAKYVALRKMQERRKEIPSIECLKEMTKKLLKFYYHSTKGYKPKRIIMYRDGVSESQFLKVLTSEICAILDACSELEQDYKPGITFICVQKRCQTRFFNEGNMEKNVPPGTVDDKNVTNKDLMDFYLVSHAANKRTSIPEYTEKATSKPGHYVVLWDANKLSMDDLQALTYNLCYISPRTPKAVSRPFPVLYAHEFAYRAHILYKTMTNSSDDSGSSSVSSDSRDLSESAIRSIEVMDVNSPLFASMYCL